MPTYFLTFATYGTHLHGDERGSTDRKATSLRESHVAPDPALQAQMRLRMTHGEMILTGAMRACVRAGIVDQCSFRSWNLIEQNVRTNHVHILLSCSVEDGTKCYGQMKARLTRLLRDAGLTGSDQPVWAERGKAMLVVGEDAVSRVVRYIRDEQGPDLPDDD